EFKQYIKQQLTQIKRTNVVFKQIDLAALERNEQQSANRNYTVSSLRLDVVVKTVYQLSRKNATKLIESERVSLNYAIESDPTTQLIEGDLLSVRGMVDVCSLLITVEHVKIK